MYQTAVEQIIGRAATDSEFRSLLFSEPDRALSEYELTPEERQKILAMQPADVEQFAARLDKTIKRTKLEI